MNSLNIDLKNGQKVVMEGDCTEDIRTVTLNSGFGMSASLAGSCVFVTLPDGSAARMDANEIEKVVE
jgi:hypothetical protein